MEVPSLFLDQMHRLLPPQEVQAFLESLQKDTPVSIRVNRCKPAGLSSDEWNPVPWCGGTGYYLPLRPTFTFDPLLHAGCYYVQEASSMFLAQVVRTWVQEPVRALDLCAAPGGKSTLLRDELPEGSLLVANEIMPQRAQVLAENLSKWGHPDVVVTHSDSADFTPLTHFFDFILTDVPCSGEGMFRKDEVAVQEWSLDNVETCWQRQRSILQNIWPALKPGGILVYSTCTFNLLEDEQNIQWLRETYGAEVLSVPTELQWQITSALGGYTFPVYRFLPHKTTGEGLFMAVLRKPAEEEYTPAAPKKKDKQKNKKTAPAVPVPKECKEWLQNPSEYSYQWLRQEIVAIPKVWQEAYEQLSACVRVLQAGVTLGTVKGRDVIPAHHLALSTVRTQVFPQAELTYEQAIAYLRKESIVLPPETPRGFVLLTYRQQPLGFVKNIGNRANNLYPQEWRIRSGYVPDQAVTL